MYIDIVPNRRSPPAILLRESVREGGKVRKRTVANLSALPMHQVEKIRAVLKDEPLAAPDTLFEKVRDQQHGATDTVRLAMRRLGMDAWIDSRRSRERDLVLAMIVARVLEPQSKLATERWFSTTTLPEEFVLEGITEEDLYAAMDWLLERQEKIEQKLAKRHLKQDGLVLYDLSSSYFEGSHCPLAAYGHNRDGKAGKLQVNYGLVTDAEGRPISVSVFKGNTGDPTTVLPQVEKVRTTFSIRQMVLVGDRGMISQKQIDALAELEGVAWITALRTGAIRALVEGGSLQLGLFDDRNLFEVAHPDFPGERLVACKNHELAKLRAHKRARLLEATERDLTKVQAQVARKRLVGQAKIGVRVGRVVNKHKVAKHFHLEIQDHAFRFSRNEENIRAEAALDGIYVVRTSLPKEQASSEETVRSYKLLSRVERAFRSLKTVDLHIRPIYHYLDKRVRAHIFLAMLAYYVEWHMKEAWRDLLFSEESPDSCRDPVAPAQRSKDALHKIATKRTKDGHPAHSFSTLLRDLATLTKSTCRRLGADASEATFSLFTKPSSLQARAIERIRSL